MCPEVRNWCYMSRYNALSEERTLQWVVWLKMLKWTPTLFPRLQWSHFVDNKLALKVTVTVCRPQAASGQRTATHCCRRWRPTPRAPASEWSCRCCREGRLWTWGAPHSDPSPWSAAEPPGGWFPSPCLGSHSTVCSGPGRWEWEHLTQRIFRSPHRERLKHQLFSSRITSLKVFTGIVTAFIEMSSSQQTKP